MPHLSIIIPTRNRAHMLSATIDSVRSAGDDLEIIVVDDASTDATAEVCAALPNIVYLRQAEQGGTAAARNRALAVARGALVAFLDDDDLRLPDSFAAQIAALAEQPDAAFCYARVLVGDSRNGLPTGAIVPEFQLRGDVYWALLERNFVPACSVVARKDAVLACGGFDERLRTMEDYDLWVRLAERHAVVAFPDVVAIYRARSLGSGQKTSDRVAHGRDRHAMLARLCTGPRAVADPARRRAAYAGHRRTVYLSMIHDALAADTDGRRDVALSYLAEARRYATLPIKAWAARAMMAATKPSSPEG